MLSCFSANSYVGFQPNDIPLPLSNDNSPHSSLSDTNIQMTNTLDDRIEEVVQLNTLSTSFDLNKSQFTMPLNTQGFPESFQESSLPIIQVDSSSSYNLYPSFIHPQKDTLLDTEPETNKENVSSLRRSPRKTFAPRDSAITKSPSKSKKDSKTKRTEFLKEIQVQDMISN